jgi:tryptophan-rich sensory protein
MGDGMARPLLVFVSFLLIGLISIPTGGPGRDLLSSLVLVGLAFVPPLVVNAELVNRFAPASWPRRAVAGAVAWAAWFLFVAIIAVVFSRVAFMPRAVVGLVGPFVVAAGLGAAFSVIAFRGRDVRPGIALTVLAFVVVAIAVIGAVWMAGRWSSPA